MEIPETRYATSEDGVSIAFQTVGDGPVDLVFDPSVYGNVEVMWEFSPISAFLERLASFSRLILHDRRGTGLSGGGTSLPDLETRARDLRTVLDACDSSRAILFGPGDGGAALALFAATYPDRVEALVWYSPLVKTGWSPDYPWGDSAENQRRFVERISEELGTPAFSRWFLGEAAPSRVGDERLEKDLARLDRHFVAPSNGAEFARRLNETDVSDVLGALRSPVLLIDRRDMPDGVDQSRYVQALIPGATLVLVPGTEFELFLGDRGEVAEAIRGFLGVERPPPATDSVLASVLFTDIVDSTQTQASMGDSGWANVIKRHHEVVREALERWHGTENDTAGDGFFVTFDGPARAVRCAVDLASRVRDLGIQIRAGVHIGECQLLDGKHAGLTVSIGARVASKAAASEVLVTQTVKDLTAGSGFTLEDTGEHELKGVPDRWHLYRVTAS